MRRRATSDTSLRSVMSTDGYPSPYMHDNRKNHRQNYRAIDPHRPGEPIFIQALTPSTAREWTSFMQATATLGPPIPPDAPQPPRDWLFRHTSGLDAPWIPPEKGRGADADAGRKPSWPRRVLLVLARNPVIPLVMRAVVWVFCLTALILGAEQLRDGWTAMPAPRRVSPAMAVGVDGIALIYLVLVARDEFAGGHVGMREASEKLRLILLDLFFIVFSAANLALAFESLVEKDGTVGSLEAQRSLTAVLMVLLVAWMGTFSISALGIVEKGGG